MAKRKQPNRRESKQAARNVSRVTASPLSRLVRAEQLNVYEHVAADEIVAAWCIESGEPATRDPDLGLSHFNPDAANDAAARRCDLLEKYRQWKTDLHGTTALAVATYILIEERTLREVERREHLRNGAGKGELIRALRHFAALRGNTPRSARDWKWKEAT